MRAVFGLVGLVVALAIVGVLAKKQLAATRTPVPSLQLPAVPGGAAPPAPPAPTGTVREQSQQVQQQVRQQVEGLMQQARPMPDDSQ
ncbi:MAG: hypothetical protein KKG12_04210 [Gammaproteobacteria bacterium]|jgi:hypothetical protein|uniref:hypothetical protein n=1 Tax=Acidovorax sp. JG5 TaxID=2822718 RepID=UPI001B33AC8D|nr:hypothetical protein [Acidovorax sp. JG5]MBP3981592.1 hypothetical protein [Acidovorax sp. JG5]MBU4422958.1 hypothetical protein [Gammaproteobacteria bacterium]